MRAIVRSNREVALLDIEKPRVCNPHDVLVQIEIAGICRTDIYAARGLLPCRDPVVLGHEFVGVVEAIGSKVERVAIGDRVVANPVLFSDAPARFAMMGVDYDGGFAEYITCSDTQLYVCPASMDSKRAAYVEPVAAALASLETPIRPNDRGFVYGTGRIAALTVAVLETAGFAQIDCGLTGEEAAYDFVIETVPLHLNELLPLVRHGGLIILKSRPWTNVSFDLLSVVRKELHLKGAHYGSFETSIAWLHEDRLPVDGLLGPIHEFEEHYDLFERLLDDEESKHFFRGSY